MARRCLGLGAGKQLSEARGLPNSRKRCCHDGAEQKPPQCGLHLTRSHHGNCHSHALTHLQRFALGCVSQSKQTQ